MILCKHRTTLTSMTHNDIRWSIKCVKLQKHILLLHATCTPRGYGIKHYRYNVFLYSACALISSIGLNYSRRTVYYSPVYTRLRRGGGKLNSIVYRVLSWSPRGAHLRPMRIPKRGPLAMCAKKQDAHIGIEQSSIKNLLYFLILMKGGLFGKGSNDLVTFYHDVKVI